MNMIAVMLGGALGALLRYNAVLYCQSKSVSLGINVSFGLVAVNVVGCFALGLVVSLTQNMSPQTALYIGVTSGFLGALTTFSAFSFEAFQLLQSGQFSTAAWHLGIHYISCLFAIFLAHSLVAAFNQ